MSNFELSFCQYNRPLAFFCCPENLCGGASTWIIIHDFVICLLKIWKVSNLLYTLPWTDCFRNWKYKAWEHPHSVSKNRLGLACQMKKYGNAPYSTKADHEFIIALGPNLHYPASSLSHAMSKAIPYKGWMSGCWPGQMLQTLQQVILKWCV